MAAYDKRSGYPITVYDSDMSIMIQTVKTRCIKFGVTLLKDSIIMQCYCIILL